MNTYFLFLFHFKTHILSTNNYELLHTPYFLRNLHWVSKTTCLIDYCLREKCWQQQLYHPVVQFKAFTVVQDYTKGNTLIETLTQVMFPCKMTHYLKSLKRIAIMTSDQFYHSEISFTCTSTHLYQNIKLNYIYHLLHYFELSWYPHQCNKEAVNEYQR